MTEVLAPAPEDLTPFAQGYVEALLTEAATIAPEGYMPDPSFRNLAPETLARIIADCSAAMDELLWDDDRSHQSGATVWRERQADQWADLPPLAVTIGDDGKVRFAA